MILRMETQLKNSTKYHKKAQSFEIIGKVDSQSDVELLWKLLRAMVHCNKRPKQIRCEISFMCQPEWSFVDADAGNLKGRIEKLDLSACQFPKLDSKNNECKELLTKVDAPNWSALAHFIEHVEINPTLITFVTTINAKSLKIIEEPFFQYGRKFIADNKDINNVFSND